MKTQTTFFEIVAFSVLFLLFSYNKNSRFSQNLISLQETENSALSQIDSLAQWQSSLNFLIDNQMNALAQKLSYFSEDNVEQVTFITGCESVSGRNLAGLSGGDYGCLGSTVCA